MNTSLRFAAQRRELAAMLATESKNIAASVTSALVQILQQPELANGNAFMNPKQGPK